MLLRQFVWLFRDIELDALILLYSIILVGDLVEGGEQSIPFHLEHGGGVVLFVFNVG